MNNNNLEYKSSGEVGKGVDKNRFIAKGYGQSNPVASNDNEEGRSLRL